jgi:hypothetical protein
MPAVKCAPDKVLYTAEVEGGSGNDHFVNFDRMQRGDGDDCLAPGGMRYDLPTAAAFLADGGAGNDTLVTPSRGCADLRGGTGADKLILRDAAKWSGGDGSGPFIFDKDAQVTIQDFKAGGWIDLSGQQGGSSWSIR